MQLFPKLDVLEKLKPLVDKGVNYDSIYLISVQHLVETTGSLFEALIDIGLQPKKMYLKGKVYSTNQEVSEKLLELGVNVAPSVLPIKFGVIREVHKKEIRQLWNDLINVLSAGDIIIILDDGGITIRYTPQFIINNYQIYGIEQTTSGLRFQIDKITFPIVQVATSAAKTLLEPYMISRALNRKLQSMFKQVKPKVIGVVGFGHIGKGVAEFLSKTYKVIVFDIKPIAQTIENKKITVAATINDLVRHADVIIGATGIDISNFEWEEVVNSNKILISVSSHDTEFSTLIRSQNRYDPQIKNVLKNLKIKLKSGFELLVFRGGSVANFDNTMESCKKNEIQLTRGLLFSGVAQILNALKHHRPAANHWKLDAEYQKTCVDTWFKYNPHYRDYYPAGLIQNFKDTQWIDSNS